MSQQRRRAEQVEAAREASLEHKRTPPERRASRDRLGIHQLGKEAKSNATKKKATKHKAKKRTARRR